MNKKEIIDKLREEYTRQSYNKIRAEVVLDGYIYASRAYQEALIGYTRLLKNKVEGEVLIDVLIRARDAGDAANKAICEIVREMTGIQYELADTLVQLDEEIKRKSTRQKSKSSFNN